MRGDASPAPPRGDDEMRKQRCIATSSSWVIICCIRYIADYLYQPRRRGGSSYAPARGGVLATLLFFFQELPKQQALIGFGATSSSSGKA